MSGNKSPQALYADVNQYDLTTNSCYLAITRLTKTTRELDVFKAGRWVTDFLDSINQFYDEDDNEITQIFSYIPNYENLPLIEKQKLLINGHKPWGGLPEGYLHYSGRVYRLIDNIVIPHNYRQYWLLICLNVANYDLNHLNIFLNRQLDLSTAKLQFLSAFKNIVRENPQDLLQTSVQAHLLEWIDSHQKLVTVELRVTKKVWVKINALELLTYFLKNFEKIHEQSGQILSSQQVEYFFHANFSSYPPVGVSEKFLVDKKQESVLIKAFREFHEIFIQEKSARIAYTIDILYNNFKISKSRTTVQTNFNKYVDGNKHVKAMKKGLHRA